VQPANIFVLVIFYVLFSKYGIPSSGSCGFRAMGVVVYMQHDLQVHSLQFADHILRTRSSHASGFMFIVVAFIGK